MDDRTLRVLIIVIGHIMWLSTAALRFVRGSREYGLRAQAPWWVSFYPPLVWVPLVGATLFIKGERELDDSLQLVGLATAFVASTFGAWSMWSLGRAYGATLDLFAGHRLKTDGPFAVVRHPMYLAIIVYHVGAALALESLSVLAVCALFVVPYTAVRIGYEERVLRDGFGTDYEAYAARTPMLLPLPR